MTKQSRLCRSSNLLPSVGIVLTIPRCSKESEGWVTLSVAFTASLRLGPHGYECMFVVTMIVYTIRDNVAFRNEPLGECSVTQWHWRVFTLEHASI